MKHAFFSALVFAALSPLAQAANIVWVSDQALNQNNILADQGFVDLLTNAGHNVTRSVAVNPDVNALNAADLVILGRSVGSGAFDSADETNIWNVQVTRPLLATNSYLTRQNRLGWFIGSNLPDQVLNPLTFPDPTDPISAFIIGGTAMNGSSTVNSMTEAILFANNELDVRGTSLIIDAPIPGGTVVASTAVGADTATFIAYWPAGTVIPDGSPASGQSLGGFRMQFLAGNREAAAGDNGGVPNAGFENLTPEGEAMFLRAVEVAINGGVVPEPATAGLAAIAGAFLLRRRRTC